MGCHSIIYIGITEDKEQIKIGYTTCTAHRRCHRENYDITHFYDSVGMMQFATLEQVEDRLRDLMDKYYTRVRHKRDYFYLKGDFYKAENIFISFIEELKRLDMKKYCFGDLRTYTGPYSY